MEDLTAEELSGYHNRPDHRWVFRHPLLAAFLMVFGGIGFGVLLALAVSAV